jgi:Fic family protein
MTRYIHERHGWPKFRWDEEAVLRRLVAVRHRQGRLLGRMDALGLFSRSELSLDALTLEVLKSSEIEGEVLEREQVRSSIARHLGMDIGGLARIDRTVEGVVEMTLDATRNHAQPLTRERLFRWHALLFPVQPARAGKITVGAWRNDAGGPMQVISGPFGRERVHFEAPAAERIEAEIALLLDWFNGDPGIDQVVKAAIAHLWFVTIHPFDDGNGRIARALTDMMLARSEGSPQRFYSMSSQIRLERKAYYDILEKTQRGSLDIFDWLVWFFDCLGRAIDTAEQALETVLRRTRFWDAFSNLPLNDRQRLIMNRLLEGFEGKLTTSKWAKLGKCSHDTALRDIMALVEHSVLEKDTGGGRSTSYSLRDV